MEKKYPVVTIITTVRNGVLTIERTIKSVLAQTYPNIQYIIIDANSTDGTTDVIRKYENHLDYWVSEKDAGIYDGFNKGIERARGLYVGILNADDYLEKTAIEVLVQNIPVASELSELPIIHGDMRVSNPSGTLVVDCLFHDTAFVNCFAAMPLNHPATFVPLSVYKRLGVFERKFLIAGDYDFILRAIRSGVNFIHINSMLVTMQTGGASSLDNAYRLSLERFLARTRNGGNLITSGFRFCLDVLVFSARKFKRIFIPSEYEPS